jgi:hypothetical protein
MLSGLGLEATGTVDELRRRLTKFLRDRAAETVVPTEEPATSAPVPSSVPVPVPSAPVQTQVLASSAPVLTPERSSRPVRVQDWRVTFNGKGDPVAFLERVEELCESDGVDAIVVPTVQDAAAATAGEDVPDTEPAAMGDGQHRPGGPPPSLQPRKLLRRRHARPVHQVGAVSSRPESHRPSGHTSTLRGGHHPIRMSSDGDLRQWDTVLRHNVSHPPPGTWNCTSADTAIHTPGKPRGEDEQNAEDHGGPVLRGRSKEVGRPSSGADVRPQHLTPRVDQVHASAAELWPRTCGTQRRPPPCTRKCHRRPRRRRRQRSRRRRSPLREASLAEGHLRARPGELSTRFCETASITTFVTGSGVVT